MPEEDPLWFKILVAVTLGPVVLLTVAGICATFIGAFMEAEHKLFWLVGVGWCFLVVFVVLEMIRRGSSR